MRDGQIVLRTSDEEKIERIRAKLDAVLRIFNVELRTVAELLNVPALFARDQAITLDVDGVKDTEISVTMRDLLLHALRPQSSPDAFATAGVREFAALKLRFPSVLEVLKPYSRWDAGEGDA